MLIVTATKFDDIGCVNKPVIATKEEMIWGFLAWQKSILKPHLNSCKFRISEVRVNEV